MPLDLTGIENQNQFYSDHYLSAVLEGDLRPLFSKWSADEQAHGIEPPHDRLRKAAKSFLRSLRDSAAARDRSEQIQTHREGWQQVLQALDYELHPGIRHDEDGFAGRL